MNESIKSIDIAQILQLIPHRYPFLLVDRVLDYQPLDYLKAVKNVTINEPFFQGHFPQEPIMPGVMMLEALAQASALLSNLSRSPREGCRFTYYFAGIDNVRFKYPVTPGDVLNLHVQLTRNKGVFWFLHGEIFVDGKLACSADLMSASKEVEK